MKRLNLETPEGDTPYTIAHRPRVTKRLHMELDEAGELVVVAPGHWSHAYIGAMLAQNSHRISRFLARARPRQVRPLQFVQAELHYYLGQQFPLNIHLCAGGRPIVRLAEGQFHIHTPSPEAGKIQSSLQSWYRQKAAEIFSNSLQRLAAVAPWASGRIIPFKLRKMKRSWGNCSADGVIKLNTHLVKTPPALISYVISHELCHLQEMNHGPRFYALLGSLCPEWRQQRATLNATAYRYLLNRGVY